MSSPAVITWVSTTPEIALRSNTADCEELLARCHETWQQLHKRAQALAVRGRNVSPPTLEPIESVEQRMRSLLTLTTSPQALALIHGYYQAIKHPWIDRMDEAEEDLAHEAAERGERLQIAADTGISEGAVRAARERALGSMAAPLSTKQRQVQTAGNALAGNTVETDPEAFTRLAAELRILGVGNNRSELVEAQVAALENLPKKIALVRLQNAIVTEGVITHQRMSDAAAVRADIRRREQVREEIQIGAKSAERLLRDLPAMLAEQYRARLAEILASVEDNAPDVVLNEFELVRRAIVEASAAGESAHTLIATLEKLGYKQVAAMETIKAEDFQGVDLRIPGCDDRVVEVRWDGKKGALATEVVRANATTGSPAQQSADTAAQKKFCTDLDRALGEIDGRKGLKIVRRTEPGARMKAKQNRSASSRKTITPQQAARKAY
jgi:hypothetical protein